jgi:hypothetical protein
MTHALSLGDPIDHGPTRPQVMHHTGITRWDSLRSTPT